MPTPPARIVCCPLSPVPPPPPQPAFECETVINGHEVDWRLAYVMAMGRWESCRSAKPPSLRQVAQEVIDIEDLQPGALLYLSALLFPQGFNDWGSARPKLLYLRDFVLGWYALAPF
ncbi:hypothetical protein RhiJN_18639 [Ceratobasidium sp. AG-Ba]|nr:hypothetical protein RhiJN_18639 [Ceratobasidium sp. AG-Ba]